MYAVKIPQMPQQSCCSCVGNEDLDIHVDTQTYLHLADLLASLEKMPPGLTLKLHGWSWTGLVPVWTVWLRSSGRRSAWPFLVFQLKSLQDLPSKPQKSPRFTKLQTHCGTGLKTSKHFHKDVPSCCHILDVEFLHVCINTCSSELA